MTDRRDPSGRPDAAPETCLRPWRLACLASLVMSGTTLAAYMLARPQLGNGDARLMVILICLLFGFPAYSLYEWRAARRQIETEGPQRPS